MVEGSHEADAEGLNFSIGSSVWIPCNKEGFQEAKIAEVCENGDFVVILQQGNCSRQQIARNEARPFYSSDQSTGCDDNTSLVHLDDANILENVRRRFVNDKIYTYTANVLLAVNPYKSIPGLYSDERIRAYRGQSIGVMPPHPYAIADTAYRYLLRERCNQALVISGESGAGKTETAKTTMRYLTSVSRTDAAQGGQIQEKIISANPILESFGNATTVRNRNSSRFGKYNQMYFNQVGTLVGAGISTYLLESSRVVLQQNGEQNYHVFYELLAGQNANSLRAMHLDSSLKYKLLYPGDAQPLSQQSAEGGRMLKDRQQQFEELRQALTVVDVDSETRDDIWKTIGALIHLGEIDFIDPSGDSTPSATSVSSPANRSPKQAAEDYTREQEETIVEVCAPEHLEHAAELLGLVSSELQEVLTKKTRHIRGQDIPCPRTKRQAYQTLQSVTKILYQRLFDCVVKCINAASRSGNSSGAPEGCQHIGTLDIYGFERLQTNSLEQLCINLANERLQQFFVEKVLKAEQEIYEEERLRIPVYTLPSSDPVVNSIQGVFTKLDEYSIKSMRNLCGNEGKFNDPDQKFCEQVHTGMIQARRDGDNPLQALKLTRNGQGPGRFDGFQIQHYAGVVPYSTSGWIEKNNDALMPEVEQLLSRSSHALVKNFAKMEGIDSIAGERAHSVTKKYLGHLDELLATLGQCNVHYIRCFNPNQHRQAGSFDRKYVLDQIIQCGTVQLVNIMHSGYPHRCTMRELRSRFSGLLPEDMVTHYSDRDFVMAIMMAFDVDRSHWTLGTKRLFLKAGQLRVLESLRDNCTVATRDVVLKIRKYIAKKKVRAACTALHFVKWLPKQVQHLRRDRFSSRLRKVIFIFVRLHRWLDKARKNLGIAMERRREPQLPVRKFAPAPMPDKDERLMRLRSDPRERAQCLQGTGVGNPELFVASNLCNWASYASALQTDVQNGLRVHQQTLKLVQSESSESVLFYNGSQILCARFCPKAYLQQANVERHRASIALEPCLSDVRVVDVHHSGIAIPLCEKPRSDKIVAMCQHEKDKRMFATCDADNRVFGWSWIGTDSQEPKKVAVRPTYYYEVGQEWTVYNMSFLPNVQGTHAGNGSQRQVAPVVLAIICAHPSDSNFQIRIVSFIPGDYCLEHVQSMSVTDVSCLKLRDLGATIPVFKMSHTGRILTVGGPGVLQFWELHPRADGRGWSMTLIQDAAKSLIEIGQGNIVSCLTLPSLDKRTQRLKDWITVGDATGKIYGFKFKVPVDGRVTNEEQGRFRTNRHDVGVPLHAMLPCYGTTPDAHYIDVAEEGLPYSCFLNNLSPDRGRFYSLGANGKMLTWQMSEDGGWTCIEECDIGAGSGDSCGFVAGQSSRLLPNVVFCADADVQRQCFYCHDLYNAPSFERPPGSVCSFAVP